MSSLPANPSFDRLRRANRFGLSVIVVAFLATGSPLGLASLLLIPIWALMTCCLMVAAANDELGRGYAVRHLMLALLTAPLVLLGPLLVPWMVESDIRKAAASAVRHASEPAKT